MAFDRRDCECFGVIDHLKSLTHNRVRCRRNSDERADVCQQAFVVQRHRMLGPQISQHVVNHLSQRGRTLVFVAVDIEPPPLFERIVAVDKLRLNRKWSEVDNLGAGRVQQTQIIKHLANVRVVDRTDRF